MHELSIMEGALGLALEQARSAGASRITALRLRVGVLSGVVPEALKFAFQALAAGTPAEGGQLIIDSIPAQFWCAACARQFGVADLGAQCPDCGGFSGELRSGRELEVVSLEVE
jgi:hydrogenase nickel incorporation protein HypA/HybF